MSEENKAIPPVPQEEPREIEEIVSPVQPRRHRTFGARNLFALAISALALFTAGYLLYGEWPQLRGGIKVANAPITQETAQTNSSLPATTTTTQIETPEPRISSITTTEPSATAVAVPPPAPQVAGQSTNTQQRVYTHQTGFNIRIPAGSSVSNSVGLPVVVAIYGQDAALLARIEVADVLLDSPESLQAQLQLSPSIAELAPVYQSNSFGYTYTTNGVPAMALIKGNRIYYITDYSRSLRASFTIL